MRYNYVNATRRLQKYFTAFLKGRREHDIMKMKTIVCKSYLDFLRAIKRAKKIGYYVTDPIHRFNYVINGSKYGTHDFMFVSTCVRKNKTIYEFVFEMGSFRQ